MAGDVGGGEAYDDDNGGHGVDVDEYHEDKCDDDEDDGCADPENECDDNDLLLELNRSVRLSGSS